MSISQIDPAPGPALRMALRLPIIGTTLRDIRREPDTIYYLLVILVTLLVLAVKTWGLVALTLTALTLVPVVFILLIVITLG